MSLSTIEYLSCNGRFLRTSSNTVLILRIARQQRWHLSCLGGSIQFSSGTAQCDEQASQHIRVLVCGTSSALPRPLRRHIRRQFSLPSQNCFKLESWHFLSSCTSVKICPLDSAPFLPARPLSYNNNAK